VTRFGRAIPGLVLALGAASACAAGGGPGAAPSPPPPDVPTAGPVRIVLSHNSYRPSVVHVRPGAALLLALENPDDEPHDLNLLGLAEPVHLFLNGHKAIVSSVTFPRPGTYRFYCSLRRHRLDGMEGDVVVDG